MDPVIVVSNVSKTFRRYHPDRPATIQEAVAKGLRRMRSVERFWGLHDVSFAVGKGRAVGIIGSNGSGKSTLLRLVGGVGRPDEGRIDVHGRIGALLDLGAGFHPDLTGRENALLAGILNGLTRKQVLERLEAIVAFAEVERAFNNPVRTYSSGMLMRLAFSIAVHSDPDVLLIDEVLSVGDISFQRKCLDRIEQFKASGCSILLVSHVGSTIEDLCDDAVWLNGGRLMATGRARDVVDEYAMHMGEPQRVELADALPQESGKPDEEPHGAEETAYPAVSPPPAIVRTTGGDEVPLDNERFGSVELQIAAVRLLDGEGNPVTEVLSGAPVRIEIGYVAASRLVAPIFYARIDRADGLLCYDLNTEFSSLSLSAIQGPGHLAVDIDRLDLNTGRYIIEVGCYAQGWAYCYDRRASACVLTVQGAGVTEPVLNSPHRWETTGVAMAPLVDDVESGGESSSL